MPVRLLTAAERNRLTRFPSEVSPEDLAAHATLSDADLDVVRQQRGGANRLGFAVQLVTLRFLGFVPHDMGATPEPIVRYLANQVGVAPPTLAEYGGRFETTRSHQALAMAHLGICRATASEIASLEGWLVERALEHDRPSVLVSAACDKLKRDRLLRPGLTVIERAVAAARRRAHEETYRRLQSVLTPEAEAMLDGLLIPDEQGGSGSGFRMTTLGWLRKRASAETPAVLLDTLAKMEWLRERGVDEWDLSAVGPNRLKMLAGLGRRYTNQALQRAVPERRYPVLVALLQRTLREATDEAVDLFDALLAGVFSRSRRALRAHDEAVARSTEDKARLFYEFGQLVLDPSVRDADLRAEIFRRLSPLEFAAAVDEAGRIVRSARPGVLRLPRRPVRLRPPVRPGVPRYGGALLESTR